MENSCVVNFFSYICERNRDKRGKDNTKHIYNMKKGLTILIGIVLASTSMQAQELKSNTEYIARQDSLHEEFSALVKVWNEKIPPHFREAMRLEKEAKEHPELQDSLLAIAAEERRIGDSFKPDLQPKMDRIQEEMIALEKRYTLVFEDAFPYFRQRKSHSKDSLSVILNSASEEIRQSRTGQALRNYIENQQITEGMPFQTFLCYDVEGNPFDWNLIKGKKIFLVHDGLWCMTHGQDNSLFGKYLHHLREVAPHCLPLIFVNCENREELRETIEEYGLEDFYVISEFQKGVGTLDWLYNDQVSPTCHYIDEQGIILNTSEGIDSDYLEKDFLGIK